MTNISVLVSGGGTNLQKLIDGIADGTIKNGRISCVISSKPGVYAIERAEKAGIKTRVIAKKDFADIAAYSLAIKNALAEEKTDLVVFAGFLSILDEQVSAAFPNIMNVHPALIPSFCGKGYYGLHVHKAVLERGVKLTGATVHFVNEICDGGPIILQKAVEVMPDDTPESLQQRVMEQAEWDILPKAVSLFCEGRIEVTDGIAKIKNG